MQSDIILLVEDNPDDVKLTIKALQQSKIGNEVIVAKDGQQALDWLFCNEEYTGRDPTIIPVVILLDLKLPRVDGLEVLRRIRADKRTELLPVVILTSSSMEQDLLKSYQLHANSYIQKPVDFEQFVRAVKQIGAYWLVINEPPPGRKHGALERHGRSAD
jgi:two-component system response regulator